MIIIYQCHYCFASVNASIPEDSLNGSEESHSDNVIPSTHVALSPIGYAPSPQALGLRQLLPSLPNSPYSCFRDIDHLEQSLSSSSSLQLPSKADELQKQLSSPAKTKNKSVPLAQDDSMPSAMLQSSASISTKDSSHQSKSTSSYVLHNLEQSSSALSSVQSQRSATVSASPFPIAVAPATQQLISNDNTHLRKQVENEDELFENPGDVENYVTNEDWPTFDPLPFSVELLKPTTKLVT
jgi:hypothetical protein